MVFYNTGQKYHSILNLEKGGTTVNCHSIFYNIGPRCLFYPEMCFTRFTYKHETRLEKPVRDKQFQLITNIRKLHAKMVLLSTI
jgi:hypothetical protein